MNVHPRRPNPQPFLDRPARCMPNFRNGTSSDIYSRSTTDSDHFNRAVGVGGGLSGSGTNVPYEAIPVTVTDGANFYMSTTGGTLGDGYMFVYSSFDPNDATLGRVLADDNTYGLLPSIGTVHGDAPLTNGDYVIVITAFANNPIFPK